MINSYHGFAMKLTSLLQHNMSARQALVLEKLYNKQDNEGVPIGSLRCKYVCTAQLTQIIDKFRALGFVECNRSRVDRRIVFVKLTNAGLEFMREATESPTLQNASY